MSRNVVTFQNKGVIDPNAYRLFGASAKSGSNPIGFFGTGLKYALAIFLRLGCRVELWHGLDRVEFGTAPLQMRESHFKVVTATRASEADEQGGYRVEQLPFTTELGKTWASWQALRELWCNALDEEGEMQPIALEPREGYTTIRVTGQAVMDAWHEREKILLQGEPQTISEGVEVHGKRGRHVYFRGIRVHDLPQPSVLTYNVVGRAVELTEDRTVKYAYWLNHLIRDAILNLTDERLILHVLEAGTDTFEWQLDFSDGEPGEAFMRVLEGRVGLKAKFNSSLLKMYVRIKGVGLTAREFELSEAQQKMYEKAKRLCVFLGLDVGRHQVKFTDSLEDNVMGRCDRGEGTVWLTKRAFMMGTKAVAGTLMEELYHMEHGFQDESRTFQNFLVDLVATMFEEKMGEPL